MVFRFLLLTVLALQTACSEDTLDIDAQEAVTSVDDLDEEDTETADDDSPENGPSEDEGTVTEETESNTPCSDASKFVFAEKDGSVNVEFENADFSGDWKLKKDGTGFSGKGYMVWEGSQHLGNPGNGRTTFRIKIENPGTYQFLWKSAVMTGNSGTDHNDTWLRFKDADNFYAEKGDNRVFPKDTGKSPNPEGASKDGWFKIYRSGNDLDFKWQARTFDNNPHDIFVVFEKPGTYTMEVSVRSSGHGIDKFVLFKDMAKENAIADSNALSEIVCD